MRCARYVGSGQIEIVDEPDPILPTGGLLVRTEACGLCSGELMDWYMDAKIPHVLGHEVAGIVIESDDDRFPTGSRIFPHHHAPCLSCEMCDDGLYVHCPQWKRTRLNPGGMATSFAVSAENLNDTHRVDELLPINAALIEPVACVAKSLRRAPPGRSCAVIGLGTMGLFHALLVPGAVGYDINPVRVRGARKLGVDARAPSSGSYDTVYVCPGTPAALEFGFEIARPGATVCAFAPIAPDTRWELPLNKLYFRDLKIATSYSCGPNDTAQALAWIRAGRIAAEQIVSDRVTLDQLPSAYLAMKRGEILKAMVLFDD